MFENHLDAIERSELPVASVQEAIALGSSSIILTFDDGGRSAVEIGENLQRRGLVGHFLITTGRLGDPLFVDAEAIRALGAAGHVIGSHSHNHPDIFRKQSLRSMVDEWTRSREILEGILQEPCETASVPGGDISKRVIDSASGSGIKYLFTSRPTPRPHRYAGTWVIGRVCARSSTTPTEAGDWARLSGWKAQEVRYTTKTVAKRMIGPLYDRYVRRTTGDSAA